MVPLKCW